MICDISIGYISKADQLFVFVHTNRLKRIETQHRSIAISGVTDNRKLQSTKNSSSSCKHKRDLIRNLETQSRENNRFFGDKDKKKYLSKRQKRKPIKYDK